MARMALPADHQPMVEMNTTPLIDVMLVLLIMFIITIPIQTHSVKLDLPKACTTCPIPNPIKNEITITRAGAILWNGTALSDPELRYLLAATRRMRPEPELHLRPDPESRYEVVDRVLGLIKRAQVSRVGFVGNEAYALRR
jgi:biopolymer transport protein ExbD